MRSRHIWVQSFFTWIRAYYSYFVALLFFSFALKFESQVRGLKHCSFSVVNSTRLIGPKRGSLSSSSFSIDFIAVRLEHRLKVSKRTSGMVPFLIMANQFLDLVSDHFLLFLLNVRHNDWLAKIIFLLEWWLIFECPRVENELVDIILLIRSHLILLHIQHFISFLIFYRVRDASKNVLLRVILYALMLVRLDVVIFDICYRRIALMRAPIVHLILNWNHINRWNFPVRWLFRNGDNMTLILSRERVVGDSSLLTCGSHPKVLCGWSAGENWTVGSQRVSSAGVRTSHIVRRLMGGSSQRYTVCDMAF